ncbi:hypothetical protein L3Y34_019065 [Caenorhabditis briggsae]|uniref:ShKT domain-containing protein n=1 Tax=Caenorhabditis briggsae TaxID=6238 RepID=A0AAE9DLY9_CAEBR|nr:hypothetical protein L3Y34_019065 [Caenorhabditis briggsae]
MIQILILALSIVTVTMQQLACEPGYAIGEVPAFSGGCPQGYIRISEGLCCEDDHIEYMTCVDQPNKRGVNECPGLQEYCNNSLFKKVMMINCPRSCGFCT